MRFEIKNLTRLFLHFESIQMKEQIEFLTAWMEFILVKREPLRDEVDYKLSLCRWMLDRFG